MMNSPRDSLSHLWGDSLAYPPSPGQRAYGSSSPRAAYAVPGVESPAMARRMSASPAGPRVANVIAVVTPQTFTASPSGAIYSRTEESVRYRINVEDDSFRYQVPFTEGYRSPPRLPPIERVPQAPLFAAVQHQIDSTHQLLSELRGHMADERAQRAAGEVGAMKAKLSEHLTLANEWLEEAERLKERHMEELRSCIAEGQCRNGELGRLQREHHAVKESMTEIIRDLRDDLAIEREANKRYRKMAEEEAEEKDRSVRELAAELKEKNLMIEQLHSQLNKEREDHDFRSQHAAQLIQELQSRVKKGEADHRSSMSELERVVEKERKARIRSADLKAIYEQRTANFAALIATVGRVEAKMASSFEFIAEWRERDRNDQLRNASLQEAFALHEEQKELHLQISRLGHERDCVSMRNTITELSNEKASLRQELDTVRTESENSARVLRLCRSEVLALREQLEETLRDHDLAKIRLLEEFEYTARLNQECQEQKEYQSLQFSNAKSLRGSCSPRGPAGAEVANTRDSCSVLSLEESAARVALVYEASQAVPALLQAAVVKPLLKEVKLLHAELEVELRRRNRQADGVGN